MVKHLIISIDGTSSTGKSTIARRIADTFSCLYIDTGAMYRALTLYCINNKIVKKDFFNESSLIEKLNNIDIDFLQNPKSKNLEIVLNGNFVENKIRSMNISKFVSSVAKVKEVRKYMVKIQHKLAFKRSVVMDGRDIGTVVFPHANYKFFLEASLHVRAKRRFDELSKNNNENLKFDDVLNNILERDNEDTKRTNSPLKKAKDSIVINTNNLNLDELEKKILSYIKK